MESNNSYNEITVFNLDNETSLEDLVQYNEILTFLINNNDSDNNNNKYQDNDNEDDDLVNDEIDVNILKKMVLKWIKLDDDIKEYNKEIKDFKSEKSQLEEKILSFMNKNEQKEIPVKDGKIEKVKSETKEPINEEYIKKCLIKSFDNVELVDKLTSDIINNRLIKESYRLSRKSTKSAKTIIKTRVSKK